VASDIVLQSVGISYPTEGLPYGGDRKNEGGSSKCRRIDGSCVYFHVSNPCGFFILKIKSSLVSALQAARPLPPF